MEPQAPDFTAQQYRLLNAWREVLADVRHLCKQLEALPDGCECGDGQTHLAGRCVCCRNAREGSEDQACEDCDSLFAKLRPAVDSLAIDTWQFFPSALEFLDLRQRERGDDVMGARERHVETYERETAASEFERHIGAVIHTFQRLAKAVDEFRAGCRASHLHVLKMAADDLRSEVLRLEKAF